jgi:hypothetical protein
MNKVQQLATSLERVLDKVGAFTIKNTVGDSVFNNRTVTVGQLLRFLNNSESPRRRGLGNQLQVAYTSNQIKRLLRAVRGASSRTDAVDTNELLLALRTAGAVPSMSRSLGRSL